MVTTRKILAFIAFNVYAFFLLSAFKGSTYMIFEPQLMNEISDVNLSLNLQAWIWGDHYILRLISAVVITYLVGFLAGAIPKQDGAKVAAIANIPSVLIWIFIIYLIGFTDSDITAKTGHVITSIIAIPLTTFVAYKAGYKGKEYQEIEFSSGTVLGIKGYHWIWAFVPIYIYSLGIIVVVIALLEFYLMNWANVGVIQTILLLLILIPVIAWFIPLIVVYNILNGKLLSNWSSIAKGFINFAVLASGIFIASGIQKLIYWIFEKVFT